MGRKTKSEDRKRPRDDADEYLCFASKIKKKHFAKGHFSISLKRSAEAIGLQPSAESNALLPMKKQRLTGDSDSDENDTAASPECAVAPSISIPASHNRSTAEPSARAKITLMEKWFPGSTLKNATLDAAHAPSLDYIDVSVAKINDAREHIISLRSAVAKLLAHVVPESDNNLAIGTENWPWRELRSILTNITLRDVFCTKKRVTNAVKWLLDNKASMENVPKSPSYKLWNNYLNLNGPEKGYEPSLSLFAWLDSASTTALFNVLVSRVLRLYKQGMSSGADTCNKVVENHLESENYNYNDEEGDECGSQFNSSKSDFESVNCKDELTTKKDDLGVISRLPVLCRSGFSEDVVSLLSFLRVIMPVEVIDKTGNVLCRSAGYGVWLYACLSAVDAPLEPDLDRLVHELFRTCCRQIRTLGEAHGICGDERGAILHAFNSRTENNSSCCRQYNTINDVKREDILAIHSIIIVLAKVFRQNQNRLIPL